MWEIEQLLKWKVGDGAAQVMDNGAAQVVDNGGAFDIVAPRRPKSESIIDERTDRRAD